MKTKIHPDSIDLLDTISEMQPGTKSCFGLMYYGYFVTKWDKGKDQLTIECVSDDQVRWIDDDQESATGLISLQRLYSALAPYDPGKKIRSLSTRVRIQHRDLGMPAQMSSA